MQKLPCKISWLISYMYMRDNAKLTAFVEAVSDLVYFLIDSGAYTNNTNRLKRALGKPIAYSDVELDDYITYCKEHLHGKVWNYIALDVLRNAEATAVNLKGMLDAGLTPMPVMVEGSTFDQVSELMKFNRYICVAGAVQANKNYAMMRYRQAYEASEGKALLHGLGYGRWPGMFQVPLFSADSSTISTGAQFGYLSAYESHTGFRQTRLAWIVEGKPVRPDVWLYAANNYRVTVEELLDIENHKGAKSIPTLSRVLAYLTFMGDVEAHGKRYFAAISNATWAHTILSVISSLTEDGMDYWHAVSEFDILNQLWKKKFDTYLVRAREILKKHTDQAIVTPADEYAARTEAVRL